jgi:hypothetical protein
LTSIWKGFCLIKLSGHIFLGGLIVQELEKELVFGRLWLLILKVEPVTDSLAKGPLPFSYCTAPFHKF